MKIFAKAKPIWLKNKRDTVNPQVGFRCDFTADVKKDYKLKITGALKVSVTEAWCTSSSVAQ